jgi:hypothetical protein
MTLLWDGLHLLEIQTATASCYVMRNPDLQDGRATNPDFVLTTPTVGFNAPAVPSADVPPFGPLPWNGNLTDTLLPLFEALGSTQTSVPKALTVSVSYQWEVVSDPFGNPLTSRTDVLLVPLYSIPAGASGAMVDFCGKLAREISDWQAAHPELPTNGATFALELTMFATVAGSQHPLVTFREVSYSLS